MSSPLSSGRLRRIIVAYTANRIGTWFGLVALMVTVFDRTHSALAVAGLLLAWQALPAFAVPALVARVEASEGRHELSALYLFEAVATAVLAVLVSHFSLPAVLLVAALDGTAALAASALLRAEVARAGRQHAEASWNAEVPPDTREAEAHEAERRANAALNVAFSLTFVLGPLLGGVMVAGAGAPAALLFDVGSFVVCGALLFDVHTHVDEAGADSLGARLTAAWSHIHQATFLRALLAAEAVALLFFESGGPIEVPYAKATLNAGDRGYGLLLTAWGVGALVGSVVFARFVKRSLAGLLGAGTLAIGIGYVGFGVAPSLALACIAAGIGGIGNGLQWPSLISVVQQLTPRDLHGRLMAAVESLAALCLAVGLMLGGGLVSLSSPRVAFILVGSGAIVTTGALLALASRALRTAGASAAGGDSTARDHGSAYPVGSTQSSDSQAG